MPYGQVKRSLRWILDAPSKKNLCPDLTEEELGWLGDDVVRMYERDKEDRAEWDALSESALKLAKQVKEEKNFPWARAANVKHPLITIACIQFAARAYPEIVKSGQVVKCMVIGDEPKRLDAGAAGPMPGVAGAAGPSNPMAGGSPAPMMAGPDAGMGGSGPGPGPMPMDQHSPAGPMLTPGQPIPPSIPDALKNPKQERAWRVQRHMNYQLTVEMPEWDEDTDRLLHVLPVVGQCYRKTYYHSGERRPVSELVLPSECVVNAKAKSIKVARRITHQLWFYENDVWERVKSGLWSEIPYLGPAPGFENDTDAPHEFLEQHRFCDLDGDGYKEPYVVTVHRQTFKVVRVVARWKVDNVEASASGKIGAIKADEYFTHYPFIPNPDGSLNSLGFGQLLEPINSAANSTLNQLLDAGTLYNAGGGFIGRGARIRGGQVVTGPGIWSLIDTQGSTLKENIVPYPVREPSAVLFQLLGFLVQAGKDISSVQDILTGDAKLAANMPVGTAMALVEQGLKVFTAIYKRIYRSLSSEFRKIYDLNAEHADPSLTFRLAGEEDGFVGRSDYQSPDISIVPVADPNLSSDMQRLLKAQALKDLSGRPGIDEVEVTRRLVRAIHPENVSAVLLTDGQIAGREPILWKPPPQPQMVVAQAKAQRLVQQAQEEQVRLQMDIGKFQYEMEELKKKIANIEADTMLKIAKAEDIGRSDLVETYKVQAEQLSKDIDQRIAMAKVLASQVGQGQQAGGGPQ